MHTQHVYRSEMNLNEMLIFSKSIRYNSLIYSY